MKCLIRRLLSLFLSVQLVFLQVLLEGCAPRPVAEGQAPKRSAAAQASEPTRLRSSLQKSYEDLFAEAPHLEFTAGEIEAQRKALAAGKDFCVSRFKDHAKQYGRQIDAAQKELKQRSAEISDDQRKQLHCRIQNLELLESEAQALSGHAIPTAYDNLNAKLAILQNWPALYRQTQQEIASGSYQQRRWGDVKDIGFRDIAANQQDDIKRGQQAIEEMKRNGLLPPELEDMAIQSYVNSVAQRIAKSSDLKIPLHVTVLQSREINAFAFPGGYLFIQRGLLEAADDEAELAGVIAHETAHITARHGYKLMKRATIASLFYQAAQIAAVVLTGGVAGIGLYYALQYGFYGLGLVLNLKLLGVSRDYELEADQLGVQYAWKAGYDPSGFIRFFDKMATKEGYVNSASWFRTHPPFYERMVDAEREIMYLPAEPSVIVGSSAFDQMKKELAPIAAAQEKEEVGKPSLLFTREEGCEPPAKLEYESGQPVEQLCASAMRTVAAGSGGK
jgi:Zn-dependent protease with chaperone function